MLNALPNTHTAIIHKCDVILNISSDINSSGKKLPMIQTAIYLKSKGLHQIEKEIFIQKPASVLTIY